MQYSVFRCRSSRRTRVDSSGLVSDPQHSRSQRPFSPVPETDPLLPSVRLPSSPASQSANKPINQSVSQSITISFGFDTNITGGTFNVSHIIPQITIDCPQLLESHAPHPPPPPLPPSPIMVVLVLVLQPLPRNAARTPREC